MKLIIYGKVIETEGEYPGFCEDVLVQSKDWIEIVSENPHTCIKEEIMNIIPCEHESSDEDGYTVDTWELIKDWHISGMGETVEQHYECSICGIVKREVYIHACTLDEEDNPI